MSYPVDMRMRKDGRIVTVYSIFTDGSNGRSYATIWSPSDAGNRDGNGHGNGWSTIPVKNLIPISYSNECGEFISHNSLNKEKVKLVNATFECSDGMRFTGVDSFGVSEASVQAKLHESLIIKGDNINAE